MLGRLGGRDGEAVRRLVGEQRRAARPDAVVEGVGEEDVGLGEAARGGGEGLVAVDDVRGAVAGGVGLLRFQKLGDGVLEEMFEDARDLIESPGYRESIVSSKRTVCVLGRWSWLTGTAGNRCPRKLAPRRKRPSSSPDPADYSPRRHAIFCGRVSEIQIRT